MAKILVINPTKHLGNLLISLGLAQHTCALWRKQGDSVLWVFDENYRAIVAPSLPGENILYYPRKAIEQASPVGKLVRYMTMLRQVRKFKPDVALDLEADSVSSLLAVLSGAKQRIGSIEAKHPGRYHQLAAKRPKPHEYYKYHQVFATQFDLASLLPHYGDVSAVQARDAVNQVCQELKLDTRHRMVAIHAGATKLKKMWPVEHFQNLVLELRAQGLTPVLIGAGAIDQETNARINAGLQAQGAEAVTDLCNRLSLAGLIDFLKRCAFYIGNDSGPMHLASALHIPAIALFGSSNEALWGPLGATTDVMRGQPCESDCNRGHSCRVNYRCLTALSAQQVSERVRARLS